MLSLPTVLGTAHGSDTYDPATGTLSVPALAIGASTLSDVVVVIAGVNSGPAGTSPNGSVDTYDPSSRQITVPAVSLNGRVYYNVVATVGSLVSIGSASGADTYDGAALHIASFQLPNGAIYGNVVVAPGTLVNTEGGMPRSLYDRYDPAENQLTLGIVEAGGAVYTNAIVTIGALLSVAGTAPAYCPAPFPADTSPTTLTVGSGTPASCNEAALAAAVAHGGVIRFNCGGPATVTLTSQLVLRTDVNTTLDGQGGITLDGQGKTRLLYFSSPNFQATKTTVTIQNLILQNGASTGTAIPYAPPPCSQGSEKDGGGAAIYIRDGILHVLNTTFRNNVGAALGPDVGGGAIYTLGSLGTTIVGSLFEGNRAANGGAIGSLFGDLSVYNSGFVANRATGNGANSINASCSVNGGETGNGGNGGAVYIDGAENYAVTLCGSSFTSNAAGAGALAGAVFRTPDGTSQTTTIDRSIFSDNSAPNGGALYFHNSMLVVQASTMSGNTASGSGGGLFADSSTLQFTNDTFAGNVAQQGLGGSIYLSGNGGTLQNVTFLGNAATGGPGKFGAAIAGGTALAISNTLFQDNTTDDCGSPMTCAAGASTGADDLQWPTTHSVCANADSACTSGTRFENPNLSALGFHGGPTPTSAPLPGSPALGIGQNCPATDQRGISRPATGCTAGAVERAATP